MNKVGIITLNWNGYKDTIECISSILENEENFFTIFLLDNGSENDSVVKIKSWLEKQYKLSYIIMEEEEFEQSTEFSQHNLYFIKGRKNLGFAKGNNFVWKKIFNTFDYTLLLNNDTVITKKSIHNMVNYMDNNLNTGVLSCDIRRYNNPGKLWNAGGYFTWYGDRKYFSQKVIDNYKKKGIKVIKTPFVTGCAMMTRREIVKSLGGFSERFFFGEEDFNYCMKLASKNVLVETVLDSIIYHKVGTSIKKTHKSVNRYILHFSNRIIDLKEFYEPLRWRMWRVVYLCAIFLKILVITKSIKDAYKVVLNIKYYTFNYEEISYKTYREISGLN